MTALAWMAGLLAVWWPIRWILARRHEEAFARANPRGPDGFIVGASPIRLDGTRPGAVLLLHGFNDSPQAVASVARTLHARGWTVRVPALAGHARSLPAFAASGAAAWLRDARAALDELRGTHADVAVGGLSMGGAIAFLLAAEQPAVRGVIGFAPYLHVSMPLRLLRFIAPVASIGARYVVSAGGRSVHDPTAAAAIIAYRQATPHLLVELEHVIDAARRSLPGVQAPVLVFHSREDNRIPAASAEESFSRLGAVDKTIVWLSGTGHVVTVDYGHADVEARAAEWLEGRLP